MTASIQIQDNGQTINIAFADILQYHGGLLPGGVAHAFQAMRAAFAALGEQPLQRRESQLAIEFSRRLQTDGEEKALAWFRKEAAALNNAPEGERAAPTRPSADVSPLRSETIHSRSRRLRGPPVAG